MNQQQLHQDLVQHFSAEEVTALARRLGTDYGALGGKTLSDKAASLVSKVGRHGRLLELAFWLVQARPELKPAYQAYLQGESGDRDARLDWLDSLAAGDGPAIEEPPTMRWDSEKHPRGGEES